MSDIAETIYCILEFRDVPPFTSFRFQGGWYKYESPNMGKKIGTGPNSCFQMINRNSLIAMQEELVPCHLKKKIVKKISIVYGSK